MAETLERLFSEYRASGDATRLGAVFDALAPELHHVALHLCGNPADAEDILQSTFLAALEGAERWDPARPLKPWMLGILANQARLQRKRTQRAPDPDRLVFTQPAEPILDAERRELLEELERVLLRLPVESRSVLLLRLRHGLSVSEIAQTLALAPGTVRSRLARGLQVVRRSLPSGLAGAFACMPDPGLRGLAAVREAVLAQASALQPTALVLSPVAGVLLMKKVLIAALLLAAGLGSLAVLRERRPPAPPTQVRAQGGSAPVLVLDEAPPERPAQRMPLRAEEPSVQKEPRASGQTVPAEATSAALSIEARWQTTGLVAADAQVTVRSLSSELSYPEEWELRTDDEGRVRLSSIGPGPVEVSALRSGLVELDLAAGEEARVELALFPGKPVDGLVVDAAGEPVGAAEIWMSERFRWDRGRVVATTDPLGRFHVEAVGADQQLGARHADYLPSYLQHALGSEERVSLRIVLEERGVPLRGRVVADDGRPLARARVLVGADHWSEVSLPDGRTVTHAPPRVVLTDSLGAFSFSAVRPGPASLRARAQGFGTALLQIQVAPDGGTFSELRLQPQASVRGQVRGAGGRAVARARVSSQGASEFEAARTKSNADGSFVLHGLTPGEVVLRAEHTDHGHITTELTLLPAQTARWDAHLIARARIFGTLLDREGAPLGDHGIALKRNGVHVLRVETTGDGHFSMPEVEDMPYTLQVKAPGDWRGFPVLVLQGVRPSFEPLQLQLADSDRGATITGFLLGPKQGVPAKAEVTLWQEPDKLWRRVPVSAEDGAFRIDSIPPGTCYVTAQAAGFPDQNLPEQELGPGQELDLGTVFLEEPARVVGTITGGSAAELEALTLELYDGNELLDVDIQRNGRRFRSQPVGEGTLLLVARGDGLRSRHHELRVHAGQDLEQEVQLATAATREVRLQRPAGTRAPRWVHCKLTDSAGSVVWMRALRPAGSPGADVDGLSVTVSAPDGNYRLTAVASNGLFGMQDVTLRSGPREGPLALPLTWDDR